MWNFLGIGKVVEGVGKVADDLFTSDEERLKVSLQEKTLETELAKGQMEINKVEAAHSSIFVAGWRPAIGWIGALAMAYQFLLYPLLTWYWRVQQAKGTIDPGFEAPPILPAQELWVILTGILGLAGMRSFDKTKGTDTKGVGDGKGRGRQ